MRMLGVLPTELGEILARLDLEAAGQAARCRIGFLELDHGLAFRADQHDQIGLGVEVGIDRAADHEFEVLKGEAVDFRIVAAGVQVADFVVADRGAAAGK